MKNSDNKYYQPKIEEFHVGFEYETLCENGNVKDDSDWNKFIFGVYDNFEFDIEGWSDVLKEYIFHELIRAKHLDREDIEECNFHYSALAKKYFLKGSLTDVEFSGLWLENIRDNMYIINDCRMPMHRTIFCGTIKNKSELKRLLIQLGIL